MTPLLSRLWMEQLGASKNATWLWVQSKSLSLGLLAKLQPGSLLNCYLAYLPGTGQLFMDDKMKDMLVDMHSPAYPHLMARANYDIDAHSYIWKSHNICRISG
jgi:hypothetical protein